MSDLPDQRVHRYTPEQLYELSMKAKVARRTKMPFDKYWPYRAEEPDKKYLVHSNAFERSALKYLAVSAGKSMHALARELVREGIYRRITSLDE